MENKTTSQLINSIITEKMVTIHMLVITSVCLLFGIVNLISKNFLIGIITIIMGIIVPLLILILKAKLSTVGRGVVLSQAQLIIIIIMSTASHEMNQLFPLMIASMAIAAIYYNKKNLIISWAIMDAAAILGLIMFDTFYGSAAVVGVIKGILGINIGAVLLVYLTNTIHKFMNNTINAQNESDSLLARVNHQMDDTKQLMSKQENVVKEITEISEQIGSSSTLMEQIAQTLSMAAEEQTGTVDEIAHNIANITKEAQTSLRESEKASELAAKSTDMLVENNSEVKNMVEAMRDITDSSHRIESIIKTIEDIAFQTNILALNAAVEAARAGQAGKGFAVVADEVRNLATKSAQAANSTSSLIQTSIAAVDKGTILAGNVAARMNSVISLSEETSAQTMTIKALTENQQKSAATVNTQIDQIADSVLHTSRTSEESAQIARSLAEQVKKMNTIVKEFE